jgi:hypothetical protein
MTEGNRESLSVFQNSTLLRKICIAFHHSSEGDMNACGNNCLLEGFRRKNRVASRSFRARFADP